MVLSALFMGGYSYYLSQISCPEGYVKIPIPLKNFCAAKYEMKKSSSGDAESVAKGVPWTMLSKKQAIDACRDLGRRYDLITNQEWTWIAITLSEVSTNWNSGKEFFGHLNSGYNNPKGRALEASEDDINDNCIGTGYECSSTEWHVQRRTHMFENGEIMWDLSGNVAEYVQGDFKKPNLKIDYILFLLHEPGLKPYGLENTCSLFEGVKKNYYCGYGYFNTLNNVDNAIVTRGGNWKLPQQYMQGLFTTFYGEKDRTTAGTIGFRCTYKLMSEIKSIGDIKNLFE